jgi:hypothetical protein
VSTDATIPEDGLQGGQTLEEVMEELTDPLDQSSRMDICIVSSVIPTQSLWSCKNWT